GGGLCKYNKKENKFETFHFSESNSNTINSDFLTCLLFDSKNRLWIGASVGLNLKYSDGKIIRFVNTQTVTDYPDGQFIQFIHEDHRKQIWVGTRGNGLYAYNERTRHFGRYTTEDGLPGNNIFGMLEDSKGFLWLSTENGISKFDPVRKRFWNYNKNDGLICKEYNFNSYMKDHTGKMYFGGYNGIVTFYPDSILQNKSVPSLVFTKLKVFNKEIKTGSGNALLKRPLNETQSIRLHYDQNVFSIGFAVLNYITPSKNKYAYYLEGFENNWNYVDEPTATYMNLKPGVYTFYAKGSNNDGVWNEIPISLKIKVLPPPWKTWWAYCLYVMAILAAFMSFMRLIRSRLKLEQNLYLEQMENKKQNELHQTKLRFFTNISHELRTPLTLIISPLETLINSMHEAGARKQLQMIQANANRLLRLVNQLLDFRKQELGNLKLKVAEGNIIKYIHEIKLAFQEYARIRNISFDFKFAKEEIKVWYDREEMEKVMFNLLFNAFKFTPEGGAVTLLVCELPPDGKSKTGYVEIVVEDNGVGIPKEHLQKIFDRFYQVENSNLMNHGFGIGLALTKGIIDLHHGTIEVISTEVVNGKSGGTKFIVTLPLGNGHFKEENIITDYKTSEQIDSYLLMESEAREMMPSVENPIGAKKDYLILVVEDNPEIRDYLKTRLEKFYTVKEAGNGQEAWDIASESLPDLVISDVMMPVMDGITLTNRMKSDIRTNHIPVILVTARNTIIHQMEGLETGADEYIAKPFNIGLLELKIRNLLMTRENLKKKYGRIITLEPKFEEISDPDEKFLQRLLGIIEEQISEPEFNVSRLVSEIGMSRPVLFRKIKALTDMSVIDLIKTTRLKKAAMLLKQKKLTISEVGYAVGFSDSKYFSKAFRSYYGKSPSEYIAESDHAVGKRE
ncbi:MAG TPA: response regulator, partial [Bacteroidales bacterium]